MKNELQVMRTAMACTQPPREVSTDVQLPSRDSFNVASLANSSAPFASGTARSLRQLAHNRKRRRSRCRWNSLVRPLRNDVFQRYRPTQRRVGAMHHSGQAAVVMHPGAWPRRLDAAQKHASQPASLAVGGFPVSSFSISSGDGAIGCRRPAQSATRWLIKRRPCAEQ